MLEIEHYLALAVHACLDVTDVDIYIDALTYKHRQDRQTEQCSTRFKQKRLKMVRRRWLRLYLRSHQDFSTGDNSMNFML